MGNSPKELRAAIDALTKQQHSLEGEVRHGSNELHTLLRNAPWKHSKQPASPQDQAQEKSGHGPRKEGAFSPSPQDTKSTKNTENDSFPWWRIVEGIGILAAVVVAGVNLSQWQDLRHNFEVDQRAWIHIIFEDEGKVRGWEEIDPIPDAGYFPVRITNSGKSPAKSVFMESEVEIVRSSNAPSLAFYDKFNATTHVIMFPSVVLGDGIWMYRADKSVATFTAQEKADLSAGRSYLAIYGLIVYEDQFGPHWTKFCWWQAVPPPSAGFTFHAQSCVAYNGVGDGVLPGFTYKKDEK